MYKFISIHTLCEEGDEQRLIYLDIYDISIHTLCEEGDLIHLGYMYLQYPFQSTPSVKRAT